MVSLRLLVIGSLTAALGCADTAPPRWPGDGDLSVAEVASDALTLEWPSASDDEGSIAHYRVLQEDDVIGTVSGSTRTYRVERLEDGESYRFGVLPIDNSGNEGGRLYVTVTTADGTPPGWNRGARLTLRVDGQVEEGAEEAAEANLTHTLRWGGASDTIGVVGYRVRVDGRVVAEVTDTEHVLAETPSDDATIDVLAYDEAGNESVPLSLARDGAPADSTVEVAENAADRREAPALTAPAAAQVRDQLERALPRVRVDRTTIAPNLRGVFDRARLQR